MDRETALWEPYWLLPVAYLVNIQWIDGVLGVIIAFTPLVGLFLHFRENLVERT